MSFDWITGDGDTTIAIIGISKNAGKTSLLNYLVKSHPDMGFGVFSTGIDGEEEDSVYKTPKPSVVLPPNTLFCCDSHSLEPHGGSVELLASLPDTQRPLWIARSLFQIETQITGPATMVAQIELCRAMIKLGAKKILIDGSLDRKSITLSNMLDATILVAGASFGEMSELETELERLMLLNQIPVLKTDEPLDDDSEEPKVFDGKSWHKSGLETLASMEAEFLSFANSVDNITRVYIPGVISSGGFATFMEAFPRGKTQLVVRHPDCLKLDLSQIRTLALKAELACLIPFGIKAIAINSEAIGTASEDAALFRNRLRTKFHVLPMIDIMELQDG